MADVLRGIPTKRMGLDPDFVEERLLEMQANLSEKDQALFKIQTEFSRLKEQFGRLLQEREAAETRTAAIGEALVVAQETAQALKRKAEEEAAFLVGQARHEAERIVAEARQAAEQLHRESADRVNASLQSIEARMQDLQRAERAARARLQENVGAMRAVLDQLDAVLAGDGAVAGPEPEGSIPVRAEDAEATPPLDAPGAAGAEPAAEERSALLAHVQGQI